MKILRMQLMTFNKYYYSNSFTSNNQDSARQFSESNFDTSQSDKVGVEMTVISSWNMYNSSLLWNDIYSYASFVVLNFAFIQILSHCNMVQRDDLKTHSVSKIKILRFTSSHLENRDFLSKTGITISLLLFIDVGGCFGDQLILAIESFLLGFLFFSITGGGVSRRANFPVPPTVGLPAKILPEGESRWSL